MYSTQTMDIVQTRSLKNKSNSQQGISSLKQKNAKTTLVHSSEETLSSTNSPTALESFTGSGGSQSI
jgi:hypothetical protein